MAAPSDPMTDRPAEIAADHRPARRLLALRPWVLLAFRAAVTALFLLHPFDMLGFLGGEWPGGVMVAVSGVEIACVLLVALGFHTRAAAFLLSGMLAFAFFVIHLPEGWNWIENGGEPAALYSWIFLLLVVLGPGPLSVDGLRATDTTTSRADALAG